MCVLLIFGIVFMMRMVEIIRTRRNIHNEASVLTKELTGCLSVTNLSAR